MIARYDTGDLEWLANYKGESGDTWYGHSQEETDKAIGPDKHVTVR